MAWAREHLATAPDGAVFLVDTFLQAHGRQGRTWQIASGQLLITMLLKPQLITVAQLPTLNMAIALGIVDPLRKYGARLKWPNDIVIQGKKLGGVLMEVVWQQPHGIVVGFALNVNNHFNEQDPLAARATSLTMETQQTFDLDSLQQDLFIALDHWYRCWIDGHHQLIQTTWRQMQAFIGQEITTHQWDGTTVTGTVCDVGDDGSLKLVVDGVQRVLLHHVVKEITL